MQNPIEKLYDQDMDRREFLTHVGAGIIAIAGVSGIVKAFRKNETHQPHTAARTVAVPQKVADSGTTGYGNGAYGR